jgi:hypothetical protein
MDLLVPLQKPNIYIAQTGIVILEALFLEIKEERFI